MLMASCVPAWADEIVIKAARVYTQDGATLVPGEVRIKDGKIAEVAATITVPAGAKVIDLGNGVLLPGLIDAHSGIAIEGGASESTLEVTPKIRIVNSIDWSSLAFRQARSDGITSTCIVPGTDNVIAGLSCVVKTAGDRPQRIMKADHSLVITLASDPGSGNSSRNRPDSIYTRLPTNRMGVVWILRNEFGRAREPRSADSILQESLAGKRPVVCVSRSESDITAALRLRKEYPMTMTIAGAHEAYKVRKELSAEKTPVYLAPIVGTAGNGPESTETILNLAGVMHDAGVPFALTGGKLLDQARLAVRFGLPKDVALAAITAAPAKLLGLETRIGRIAVGSDADLIVLSGDPFELSTTIRWTMIDGVIRAEE
jgi:imidazolonepropionase-like amidohydrolase